MDNGKEAIAAWGKGFSFVAAPINAALAGKGAGVLIDAAPPSGVGVETARGQLQQSRRAAHVTAENGPIDAQ